MAGGALTLSVGLSAASRPPFPPRRGNPGGPQQPRLESSPTCAGWGPGSHRAGLGEPRIGEGAPGTPSGEGRWEAREAGRARSAPALVGGCEQVAVGVCRACQQLCQERLARARAQEAGSCQPLARAVRGVRTPPPIGAHTASSRTPTSSWGWGSPRTKEGEGALVERALGGGGTTLPTAVQNQEQDPAAGLWDQPLIQAPSPPGTYRARPGPDGASTRLLIPPLSS